MKMTEEQILVLVEELQTIAQEIDEDRLPRWRDLSYNFSQASDTVLMLQNKLSTIRQWVALEGERTDTCVYNVLGVRCSYCKCWRNK